MKFSERKGITQTKNILQTDSVDEELQNSLWSVLTAYYWDKFNKEEYYYSERINYIDGSNLSELFTSLWLHYFK